MPLPPETLAKVKEDLDKARAKLADVDDIIADLKASGINTAEYEERRKTLRESIRQLETFYNRQSGKS